MINTRDIILKLKEVRKEKALSLNDIAEMTEKNDPSTSLSKSSVQRVFKEGSEDEVFDFEKQLKPIASVLLDIDIIEESDSLDTQAMKTLLQFKSQRIKELEQQIDKLKLDYHEKMEKERERWGKSIEFLKEQISYKDKRMDLLLESVQAKDSRYNELLNLVLSCPCRKKMEGETV